MNSNNSDTHSWRDPTDTTHGDCWIHVDIVSSSSRHWPRHTRRRTSCYTYKHCIRRGLDTNQQIVMRLWALADYYELSSWIILNKFFEKLNQEWMSCFLSKHWKCIIDALLAHICWPLYHDVDWCPCWYPECCWQAGAAQQWPVSSSGHQHQSPPGSRHIGTLPVSTC